MKFTKFDQPIPRGIKIGTIKDTDSKTLEDKEVFDLGDHLKRLQDKLEEIIDQEVEKLITEINSEDIEILKGVLSKEINNPKFGSLARILRIKLETKNIDSMEKTKRSSSELRKLFLDFNTSFYTNLDSKISPKEILGLKELNKEAINKRSLELLEHQRSIGAALKPMGNFTNSVIKRVVVSFPK